MAGLAANPGKYDSGLISVCRAAIGISPLPMAVVEGRDHVLRCVNQAFCKLADQEMDGLLGRRCPVAIPVGEEFMSNLDFVYRTGQNRIQSGENSQGKSPLFTAYVMWPILDGGTSPIGVMIQISESGLYRERSVAINEALLLTSLRQHETAEKLNEQLRTEELERDKALRALVKSEKLASLGRMAASIAHEINNPLEAVTNTIYLAKTVPDLPENARQYLDMADAELHRIAHIAKQTLGFYRETSAATRFSVKSLLESVSDLLRSRISISRAAVEWQVDQDLQITAHFGELRQVFSNLIQNSLDAVKDGGKIRIRATTEKDPVTGGRRIRISASDSGSGIKTETLPQIFEPFFTTKGSVGNGLGLWVSKEIIKKHGGKIHVRSSTSGSHIGTTFSVVLPEAAAA